jgi:acetoin utilization deacetylase AcuC-like enzyme
MTSLLGFVSDSAGVQTVFSDKHRLHDAKGELIDGALRAPFECPERAELVLAAVRAAELGDVVGPAEHGIEPLARVHDERFLAFLQEAWAEWLAVHGDETDALPLAWPTRRMGQREPEAIDGRLSYFSFDAGSPITPGTAEAVLASADVALTGVDLLLSGERAAFSLCRPPGHHAALDLYGGYCFVNNAAAAVQALRDGGMERVALVDVDYHHGNGSQDIFWSRGDVLVTNLHGDPRQEYPFFTGYADERGDGEGVDANRNYPLPMGTKAPEWFAALDDALGHVRDFQPDAVVVSLGVDTFVEDPISCFELTSGDYPVLGGRLADLGRPTLFVMEGGYAVDAIGTNVAGVLTGFEGTTR